jgi:hypothetical protein
MPAVTESIAALRGIDGAMAAAIVDSGSGMMLAGDGHGVDLEVAAAGNTEIVRAKLKTMQALGLRESIEDILITLSSQYHIIRPVAAAPGVFLYVVLDSAKANLAMARLKIKGVEGSLAL